MNSTTDNKLAYIHERIRNEPSFVSVEVNPNSAFLITVGAAGPFENPPRVLFDIFDELVEELNIDALSIFLEEAIDIAREKLSNPSLGEYGVQGRVKVNHNGASWVPRE